MIAGILYTLLLVALLDLPRWQRIVRGMTQSLSPSWRLRCCRPGRRTWSIGCSGGPQRMAAPLLNSNRDPRS